MSITVRPPRRARTPAPAGSAGAGRLSDMAYTTIRDRIVRHDLPPGAVLNERQFMRELGVGRTPLREALQRLAADRLVVVLPRYGAFVASISMGDLSIITEVRIAIEGYAAALAAERRTEDEMQGLERSLGEAAEVGEDFVKIGDIDQRLHTGVAKAARNEHLLDLVIRYHALTARMWHLSRTRPPFKDQMMYPEWEQIVGAIRRRQPDEAENAMRRHIMLGRHQLHNAL
jgi:DNA-binding GntR family transcriptional regulator